MLTTNSSLSTSSAGFSIALPSLAELQGMKDLLTGAQQQCARRASICGCEQHTSSLLSGGSTNLIEYEEINNALDNCELLLLIMSFLGAKDLCKCAQVCQFWRSLCDDHTLWKELVKKAQYPADTSKKNPPEWASSWKDIYSWFYECKTNIFKENETRNGKGTHIWSNGCNYYGEWKENKEHGRGYKTWTDGATFEGEWKNAKFNGRGRHTWASGSTYEGQWVDHKRNGRGCNTWSQKDSYIGEWFDDEKNGYGTYIWSDQRRYEGTWKNDKRFGKGIFVWPVLGCKYDGDWADDKRHGFGKFYWKDGDIYEGEWRDGKRCGKGKLITTSGQLYLQEWNETEDFDSSNKGDLSQLLPVDAGVELSGCMSSINNPAMMEISSAAAFSFATNVVVQTNDHLRSRKRKSIAGEHMLPPQYQQQTQSANTNSLRNVRRRLSSP